MKIKSNNAYRSPVTVLKTLANSRLELVLQKNAVRFDATDISRAYAGILTKKYNGNRMLAEKGAEKKTRQHTADKKLRRGQYEIYFEELGSIVINKRKRTVHNSSLKKVLKKLFMLKASGNEEAYITGLQQLTGI